MTHTEFTKEYEKNWVWQKFYSALGNKQCFMCRCKTEKMMERIVHLKVTHGIDPEALYAMCQLSGMGIKTK